MMFKRLMALLMFFSCTIPLHAADPLYKVTNIFAEETLNIRQGASVKSPILSSLPYNAKNIKVIQRQAGSTWVKISISSSRSLGWVNSHYLKPHSNKVPNAYSCSGTEPFWRVDIDLQRAKIEAHVLSGSSNYFNVSMLVNVHVMSSPQESRIITGSDAKHSITAFISEGSCNDGMSDKVFDYQITGLLDNKAYQGCCGTAIKATGGR